MFHKENGIWEDLLEDELSDTGYQCMFYAYLVSDLCLKLQNLVQAEAHISPSLSRVQGLWMLPLL